MNASSNKNIELDIVRMQKSYFVLLITLCANQTKIQDLYMNDRSPTCAESVSRTSMINNAGHDDCLHPKCSQNDRQSRCKIESFFMAYSTQGPRLVLLDWYRKSMSTECFGPKTQIYKIPEHHCQLS